MFVFTVSHSTNMWGSSLWRKYKQQAELLSHGFHSLTRTSGLQDTVFDKVGEQWLLDYDNNDNVMMIMMI